MKKMMTGWIAVVAMVMMAAPGFATVINYEFESGTDAVDTGGGGFDSALIGAGMSVVSSGAKFGTGSLRVDANAVLNYTLLTDLTGDNSALSTSIANFSFSIYMKPDDTNFNSSQLTLFTRRAAASGKGGNMYFYYRTDGYLKLFYYSSDGVYVSKNSTAAFDFTADTYAQLGVTYDAGTDEVVFYANGAQLGSVISVPDIAAISAISSSPETAYIRFASDAAASPTGVNYDNIIYDDGATYSAAQMNNIYTSGTIPEPATIGMLGLGGGLMILARCIRM